MFGHIGDISPYWLVLALALKTAESAFIGLGWRNILRAAYPKANLSFKMAWGVSQGGTAINAVTMLVIGAAELTVAIGGKGLLDSQLKRGAGPSTLATLVPATIDADVADGFVTLSGTANWQFQREEASRLPRTSAASSPSWTRFGSWRRGRPPTTRSASSTRRASPSRARTARSPSAEP